MKKLELEFNHKKQGGLRLISIGVVPAAAPWPDTPALAKNSRLSIEFVFNICYNGYCFCIRISMF